VKDLVESCFSLVIQLREMRTKLAAIAKLNGLKIKQVQQEVAVFGFHLIYNCS